MTAFRMIGALSLGAALLAPAACGGQRGFAGGDYGACQQSVAWGGWDGTPHCAGLAATVIGAEARACARDTDCVLVGATTCSAHAVNQGAFSRYGSTPAPCTHPLSGMCSAVSFRPICDRGCCVATQASAGMPPR